MVKKSGRRLIVAVKIPLLAMVGTILAAQAVDGNSSLGNIALVFEFGFWAGAVIPIGLGVCLIITGIAYAKKLNKMSMFTLPDFYFRRYGNGAEGISGILMIISFTILVAGNLAASGFILEVVFGIDYFWGITISALVVVAYTIAGGLFASAWTNLFQVYLAIGAFWAGFIFFAGGFSGVEWDTIYNNAPPEFMDITGLTDIANGALINWAGILALGLGDIVALDFMERVFDEFGVDHDYHSEHALVIKPTDHMLSDHFPGLNDEGNTITFDRNKALSREDMEYLIWEQPMVVDIMEAISSSEIGNASVATISIKGLKPGTLLLESCFTVEKMAPRDLQLHRYLPVQPIRLLFNTEGKDLSKIVSHENLNKM